MAIDLPELSAKICGVHGTHRSQYLKAATTEVIRSITAILCKSSSHEFPNNHEEDNDFQLPLGIPAESVYDISELCAPFVNNEEIKPLVEALLQCSIGATLPGSKKTGLSPAFVSSVRDKAFELSYPLQIALWTKDISAFEQDVLTAIRLVTHSNHGDINIEELLTRSHLPQACYQHSQLFHHIRDLFKTELLASKGDDSVVNFIKTFHKLFRRELTCPHSKQPVPSSYYSYYPTHLHSLLHLMTTTVESDIGQLWNHIDHSLNSAGNTCNMRIDVWLLLVEFDRYRDGDTHRLQLLSHDHTVT